MLIVLTENHWLYAGLAALVPDKQCLQVGFGEGQLPMEIRNVGRVIIAVDSRIVFRGEWSTFYALKGSRPDASVVWLTREDTGRMFPFGSLGDLILIMKQDIVSLRSSLRQISRHAELNREEERVAGIYLTQTELRLLPHFLSGRNMPLLSRLTEKPVKTLYTHRRRILIKVGFRQLSFLQFVHTRNRGLPGIPVLESADEKP